MYKYVILFLLALIGMFLNFDTLGSIGNIAIKIIVFFCFSYFLYDLWRESFSTEFVELPDKADTDVENHEIDHENNGYNDLFFEIKPVKLKDLLEENELHDFLIGQFLIIWNFLLPGNGYLFLKSDNGKLTLINKKMSSNLIWNEDFDSPGILPLIDNKDGLLVENNLEPSSNLLPFYNGQNYKPRSLLALRTDLDTNEKLYWIFDADSSSFFNLEDIPVLRQINQNTRSAVTTKLQYKSTLLRNDLDGRNLKLAKYLNTGKNFNECIDFFVDFLATEFEASKLTIATKDIEGGQTDKAVINKAVGIDDPFRRGYQFLLDDGLNGWVILKNKSYLIDNIDKGDYFIPRFSKQEKSNHGLRSFLSVPIRLGSEAIGMITLEHEIAGKYKDEHKNLLAEYSNLFSHTIERFF